MEPDVAIPKLFWPNHLCSEKTTSGFLVGWNSSEFVYTVATVISYMRISELEHLLSRYSAESDPIHTFMNETCGAAPIVLGMFFNRHEVQNSSDWNEHPSNKQQHDEWIIVKQTNEFIPQLQSIRYRQRSFKDVHPEIVFYDQPNPITTQYLSLDPILLNIYENHGARHFVESTMTNDKLMCNVEMHYGKAVMLPLKDGLKEHHFNYILNQINFAYSLERLVKAYDVQPQPTSQKSVNIYREDVIFSHHPSEKETHRFHVSRINFECGQRWVNWFRGVFLQFLIPSLFMVLYMTGYVIRLANLRFPNWLLNGHTYGELSALVRQMELRFRQVCLWPSQFVMLRRKGFRNTIVSRAYFIR